MMHVRYTVLARMQLQIGMDAKQIAFAREFLFSISTVVFSEKPLASDKKQPVTRMNSFLGHKAEENLSSP
jgi:hypothetical protein